MSCTMPPFPNIQNDRPVADHKQGIHHKPERHRVHHARIGKVGKGQASAPVNKSLAATNSV